MASSRTAPHGRDLPAPLPDAGSAWALFLDVDGTLIGFRNDPEDVSIPASLKATLKALHVALDGALALVSGRRLEDLDRLLGPPLIAAAGLHGLQRRREDGSADDIRPEADRIESLHHAVSALAAHLPHMRVEDKNACIALHYREAPELASAVTDGARAIAARLPGYEIQPGNHSVEIKPAGMDKGRAVTAFLAEPPFSGRLPVYVGDDLTDEHAFAIVNAQGGISIRVGQRNPTRAPFMLRDPAAVEDWLEQVLEMLTAGSPR